jgi:hypothetical protein
MTRKPVLQALINASESFADDPRRRTPERALAVNARDYPILKRQIAKLRADFATWLYENSEPIPTTDKEITQ